MCPYKVFCDGGSRQGLMAYGIVIYNPDGNIIKQRARGCGNNGTSNLSEYRALIAALKICESLCIENIEIYMDSQLIVRQINGEYGVNKKELREHKDCAIRLLEYFDTWSLKWIPRHKNKYADNLVKAFFMAKKRKNGKKH